MAVCSCTSPAGCIAAGRCWAENCLGGFQRADGADTPRQIPRAVLRQQRTVAEDFRRGVFARFDFIAIVPVAAPKTFGDISRDGQVASCPLPEYMEVLVQHQRTVREEFLAAATQVDAVAARG